MTDAKADFYRTKRILITGASGFIGTHVMRAVAPLANRVFLGVRTEVKDLSNIPKFVGENAEIVQCDVADPSQLAECFQRIKPDIVFNLAAAPRDNSLSGLHRQWAVTGSGAVNVSHQCMLNDVSMLIQLGSSEEYGDGPAPFTETQEEKPISAYSVSKVSATRFLIDSHRTHKLPVIIARPTVAYGPEQTGEMFVPHLLKHYSAKQIPSLSPCEQTRDFVYIDDVISALLQLAMRSDLAGNVFNISSAQPTPLQRVAVLAAKLTGYTGDLGIGKRSFRANEVMNHCANHDKITKATGWQPTVSLEDGLARTTKWWQTSSAITMLSE